MNALKLPERSDQRTYPRGHVWTRNPQHEAMVLKIISTRDFPLVGREG